MIELLSSLDKNSASGVLARAALYLNDSSNPASSPILQDESALREEVISAAIAELGFNRDRLDGDAIERIGDYLDEQSEKLIGPPQTDAAIARMIESGDLPTDLYDVRIVDTMRTNLGKWYPKEEQLILKTVHDATRMQHYGPPIDPGQPALVSLFARRFRTKYPFKDFTMLVAGHRGPGKELFVHIGWRIYDAYVSTEGAKDLVDLLRRFADTYGYEITLNGVSGRFFLTSEYVHNNRINVVAKGKQQIVTVTQLRQHGPGGVGQRAALVIATDLEKYLSTLSKMDEEIVSWHDV
jgi:hypothetical protein